MIEVYFGTGKGKTTAAAGLALRLLEAGESVLFVQFLKAGTSGEAEALRKLGAQIIAGKAAPGFASCMSPDEREATCALHNTELASAYELMRGGKVGAVLLDEVLDAYARELIDAAMLRDCVAFAAKNPQTIELVLTGRTLPPFVEEAADYITEMRCVRHPFAKGVRARRGVEY